jgi:hypothetical protein
MRARPAFADRFGPWALVAGAGEGLGAEFARQLGARGLELLLVDRRPGPLLELGRELGARCLVADLARAEGLQSALQAAAGLELGLLVQNAAASPAGPFLELAPEVLEEVVALNCSAPARFAHTLGRAMAARGRGGLVLVGSLAGLQGNAWLGLYAASKAYLLVLAESLGEELRPRGVEVLAVLPGATDTPGYRAQRASTPTGLFVPRPMSPRAVVAAALDALGRQRVCVPGPGNQVAAWLLQRVLPRRLSVRLMSAFTARTLGR